MNIKSSLILSNIGTIALAAALGVSVIHMKEVDTLATNNQAVIERQEDRIEALSSQVHELVLRNDEMWLAINTPEVTPDPVCGIEEPPVIDYDYEYVVSVIAGECDIEPLEGKMAVAQVVMERAEAWDMNPEEVIRQPNQFQAPPMPLAQISDTTWEACDRVILGGEKVTDSPIKWFCNIHTNSSLHNSKTKVMTIGRHNFYM